MNKSFLITDVHVLRLYFPVLSSTHGYISFLGWQSSDSNPQSVGYAGSVSVLLLPFPLCWLRLCVPTKAGTGESQGLPHHILCVTLPYLPQHHIFLFSLLISRVAVAPPALLTLVFVTPYLQPLSTFSQLHFWSED